MSNAEHHVSTIIVSLKFYCPKKFPMLHLYRLSFFFLLLLITDLFFHQSHALSRISYNMTHKVCSHFSLNYLLINMFKIHPCLFMYYFLFALAMNKSSYGFTSLPSIGTDIFHLYFSHCNRFVVVGFVVLIWNFLMTNDVEILSFNILTYLI